MCSALFVYVSSQCYRRHLQQLITTPVPQPVCLCNDARHQLLVTCADYSHLRRTQTGSPNRAGHHQLFTAGLQQICTALKSVCVMVQGVSC